MNSCLSLASNIIEDSLNSLVYNIGLFSSDILLSLLLPSKRQAHFRKTFWNVTYFTERSQAREGSDLYIRMISKQFWVGGRLGTISWNHRNSEDRLFGMALIAFYLLFCGNGKCLFF